MSNKNVEAALAILKDAAEKTAADKQAAAAVAGTSKRKAGFFTSEFCLAALALASNVLTHSGLIAATDGQHSVSTIASAIVALVLGVQYAAGRTVLKSGDNVTAAGVAAEFAGAIGAVVARNGDPAADQAKPKPENEWQKS